MSELFENPNAAVFKCDAAGGEGKAAVEPSPLVLSLFPGIGLLDRGFEAAGFTVVRGPDTIWGGDICRFHAPAGKFDGVIGGPPCQKFSLANRKRDIAGGMVLVNEFFRVVREADPKWFLMENVPGSPDCDCPGYTVQRFTLDASHVGSNQRRLRKFHFGYRASQSPLTFRRRYLDRSQAERTVMATDGRRGAARSWQKICALQGLPAGFDLPPFTVEAKVRAVGNGVPFPLAYALALAVRESGQRRVTPQKVCVCGCGEFVTGKQRLATVACRKRESRRHGATRGQGERNLNLVLQYELPGKI